MEVRKVREYEEYTKIELRIYRSELVTLSQHHIEDSLKSAGFDMEREIQSYESPIMGYVQFRQRIPKV